MRIGILADIHGQTENLRLAIDRLRRERVDKFIVLGDLIDNTTNAVETTKMLTDCGAEGVWGNHDLGLCLDPDQEMRELYTAPVAEYFGTLKPQFECGDILFSHNLPTESAIDPTTFYLGPEPDDHSAVTACFESFPHRVMLVGHFHCWLATDTHGPIDWCGETTFKLQPDERYFFVVHAVKDGWAAVLDDEVGILMPIRIGS